jgi:hypothetical protein
MFDWRRRELVTFPEFGTGGLTRPDIYCYIEK